MQQVQWQCHPPSPVSSAPCFSNQPYPFADLHPHLRRIYDVYGPRRMLWGADLSRLTSSYSECLDLFRHALDFLSNDDKEWILGRAFGRGFELAGIRLPLMPG